MGSMGDRRAQATENLFFGIAVLVIGTGMLILWAVGELMPNESIASLGRWGLGFLIIVIEGLKLLLRVWK